MEIPHALQASWIRQLRSFFDLYNDQYLNGCLQPPVFRLSASSRKLGEWCSFTRTLSISEHHILSHPWEAVLDTLRHEMAHQYVHETLQLTEAPPHGDAFTRACRLLRCKSGGQAAATDLGDIGASASERDRMTTRVKELFALAESPNEHEAASAMRMANKYLLKYNLALAEVEGTQDYVTRNLGKCSGRVQEYEYALSNILQEHFFVLVIWTFSYDARRNKRGRILEISGKPENVEIAAYVHAYVLETGAALWKQRRRTRATAGGTRLQYLAGLVRGLAEKLDRQRRTLKEEHGLIWRGDPALKDFFRRHHPLIQTVGRGGVSRGESYFAGKEDGRSISIRRPLHSSTVRRGRLLE